MKRALIDISGRSNSGPVIAIELAKALAENGYEVYAIVAKNTLNLEDWLKEKSLKEVYVIQTYTSMKNVIPMSFKFQFMEKRKIKKHFKGIRFDYLFKPIFHIWAEGIAAQIETNKIVTLCHDPVMHSGENALKHFLYIRHIKNSDDVVVLTKSFKNIVSQNYGFSPDRVHYMPHGLMRVYKEKQNQMIPCQYDTDKVNFLFFGRIQKYKGVEILLDAYEKLRKSYSDVSLTIAGKGKLEGYSLVSNHQKNVRVINDYIPDEEVGCYFDGPNIVVVLPYLDATQSGVIPIAMEYGTPIIASDTGGLREQMLDGTFGIFTKVGDSDDLAEKMKLFIDNQNLFAQQQEIMNLAVKQLEWKKVVAKLLEEI